MLRTTRGYAAAALGLLLGVTACHNDELFRPANLTLADPLFTSYVSMGNSITAGFQSGGINEATQLQSYAVLLAQQMGTPFFSPLMNQPGCPSLFTNVFTQTRVSTIPCALRTTQPVPPPFISNVAVPGAEVMDAISNLDPASNANALTTFFLGALTQIEAMERARPTFVTLWLGNNDVLGAATNSANAGDGTLITPVADFTPRYDQVLDAIEATGAEALLIGVANVTAIPFFSLGSTYWAIDNGFVPGQAFPPAFVVGPNCAPAAVGGNGDQVLVPFPFGGALLTQAAAGTPTTLACTEPQTIQPPELATLVSTVTAYNAYIASQATARAWAYLDPNPVLDSLRTVTGQVAPFPAFGAACSANPFGLAFSCDAVHPSAATHKLIANYAIDAINAHYGSAIPAIP